MKVVNFKHNSDYIFTFAFEERQSEFDDAISINIDEVYTKKEYI